MGLSRKSLRRRVERLQKRPRPAVEPQRRDRTEDEWLEHYRELQRQGMGSFEPDYERAVEHYAEAIAAARLEEDATEDPPPAYLPELPLQERRNRWRDHQCQQGLKKAFAWLVELGRRVMHGIPPVTEAEFTQQQAWYQSHREALLDWMAPDTKFELTNGASRSVYDFDLMFSNGARAMRVGETFRDLKLLRELWEGEAAGS